MPDSAQAPGEQIARVRRAVRAAGGAGRAGPAAAPASAPRAADPPASELPVARVALDVPLGHLDRPYDYLVSEPQSAAAVPGARVKVRFAGQDRQGFILERLAGTGFPGQLARLSRVVSPEPVLSPEVLGLARAVADRWVGTLADVLRLAVPPRHATVEREVVATPLTPPPEAPAPGPWGAYPAGASLVRALARGDSPRAVWPALPGGDWAAAIAVLVRACLSSGRGALVVVPDFRDVARVDAALAAALGTGHHVALTAELGPAKRYRRWLAARRGHVRAVVGTRAATYAPVADLGLVVIWDDGDDLHAEPRAPYAHTRDVLLLRARLAGCAAVVGGHAVTAEGALLVATGWAHAVRAERAVLRQRGPRVLVTGADAEVERDPAARTARLPSLAWRTARDALVHGPVLVQVPRAGYLPAVACAACRAPARCGLCAGPLGQRERGVAPECGWCRTSPAGGWECPACEGSSLRAVGVGARRTAEELGRAFPGVRVLTSGRDGILTDVPDRPALVVATPGAEPVAAGGYAAALLLDARVALGRADLRAGEEALRRWMGAAALVRPAPEGGTVVLVGDASPPPVQALVRWDPLRAAERELADRRALGFPPVTRVAALTAPPAALRELLDLAELPAGARVIGPLPVPVPARAASGPAAPPAERVLIRVTRSEGAALAASLRAAQGVRSARKSPDHVRIQIDPLEIG